MVVAVGACGDNDRAVADAMTVDAPADAGMAVHAGSMSVAEGIADTSEYTLAAPMFEDYVEATSSRVDGPCRIDLVTTTMIEFASAGVVTFSGVGQNIVLIPDSQNRYMEDYFQGARFAPGDEITMSASGATVPAFTTTMTFPVSLNVTSPTSLTTVSASHGLTATWTPTVGMVTIALVQTENAQTIDVACTFSGAAGTGTVPATALTDLVQGTNDVDLTLTSANSKTVPSGPYDVSFTTTIVGFETAVTVQP